MADTSATRNQRVVIHHARTNALDVSVELDGDVVCVRDIIGVDEEARTTIDGRDIVSSDAEIMLAEAVAKLQLELNAYTVPRGQGLAEGAKQRLTSLGIFAWLAILEKEAHKLSEGGATALALLREDLDRMAEPSGGSHV